MQYVMKLVLDGDLLLKTCNLNNPYDDIMKFLLTKGFDYRRGDFYFANIHANAVECTCAVMDLSKAFPWINACVKECQLLRVEEKMNLIPAISHAHYSDKRNN